MENGPGLKMYFLLEMVIFHCYVSLPEGTVTLHSPPLMIFKNDDFAFGKAPEKYEDMVQTWHVKLCFKQTQTEDLSFYALW